LQFFERGSAGGLISHSQANGTRWGSFTTLPKSQQARNFQLAREENSSFPQITHRGLPDQAWQYRCVRVAAWLRFATPSVACWQNGMFIYSSSLSNEQTVVVWFA
jgi:hypothetical protein